MSPVQRIRAFLTVKGLEPHEEIRVAGERLADLLADAAVSMSEIRPRLLWQDDHWLIREARSGH